MKRNRKQTGLLLAPDDLEVGQFIAVHSLKGSNEVLGCFGMASEIRAINLPFIVVRFFSGGEIETVDVRYVNLMPVTQEFVQEQAPHRTTTAENGDPVNIGNAEP